MTLREEQLLRAAEEINELLRTASVEKHRRTEALAAVLLAMASGYKPSGSVPAEELANTLRLHTRTMLKRHFCEDSAAYIEPVPPRNEASREKWREAVLRTFTILSGLHLPDLLEGGTDVPGRFYESFLRHGGAGDLGIVLTPRHMAEFACRAVNVQPADTVYDPACGTGGFLVAAYDAVRLQASRQAADAFGATRLFGTELQPAVAALARLNLIFRGGASNITVGSCLEDPYAGSPAPTKAFLNPPFSPSRKRGAEHVFLLHTLERMAPQGLLFAIVPTSVMFTGGQEAAFRRQLLKHHTLCGVISLPDDLFYPAANVETAAVIVRSHVPHPAGAPVLWARVTDDGYRPAKRKRLPANTGSRQLWHCEQAIRSFLQEGALPPELTSHGWCQAKPINRQDKALELIPQAYLDAPLLQPHDFRKELKSMYTELLISRIREDLDA